MTLAFSLGLDSVKINQHGSEVIELFTTYTDIQTVTHTGQIAIPKPLNGLEMNPSVGVVRPGGLMVRALDLQLKRSRV